MWKELFLFPKQTFGTVIQLAIPLVDLKLALHLGNAVPPQLDPISLGFHGIRRASRFLAA